jgi:serine/threonine protein phosphatase PrpC
VLAPLDVALHPDPSVRPANGLAWLAAWQHAAVSEENRGHTPADPNARLQVGYDSHIGRSKILLGQTNQDAIWVSTRGPLSLLVVCDGISTANAGSGDVASSIATHVLANLWDQALPRLSSRRQSEIRDFLDRALRTANTAVCDAALRIAGGNLDGRVPMGTTLVTAISHGNQVHLAWLGDSRAYLLGPYGASLLTADENQACERLKAWHLGYIESWEATGFALVGYLGHFNELARAEALPAHHATFTLLPGERLLLMSDGISDYLGEHHPEVAHVLAAVGRQDDPDETSRALVGLANRAGGGDNCSIVVASLW